MEGEKFLGWLRVAEPEAILGATIYFDLRALYGDETLVSGLQAWLLAQVRESPAFLRAMAESALNWQSPLGWWSNFRYDDNPEFPIRSISSCMACGLSSMRRASGHLPAAGRRRTRRRACVPSGPAASESGGNKRIPGGAVTGPAHAPRQSGCCHGACCSQPG